MHNGTAPSKIAVVTVCLDPASQRNLAHFLSAVGGAAVGNLDHYSGVEREVGRLLNVATTSVCVIDYDRNTDEAIRLTDHLRSEFSDLHLFAASAYSEPERIIAAMRPGCAEYLLKPFEHDRLLQAFTRAEAKQKERKRSKVRGKVIALVGAKGGTGVTSLALHLALELSDKGQRKTVLVDQHPALGDASLYLGTGRHHYSFYELTSNRDRLDEDLLKGFLAHHDSGLHFIDAPDAVDPVHAGQPLAVEQTLSFLAETYRFVVVDNPPGLSDATLACIAQADKIAIVMTAELPSVRNSVRYIDHLTKLGYSPSSIQIVLNRFSKRGPLADDRIEKTLGRPVSFRIPNSYADVVRAINAGTPIPPDSRSDFSTAIRRWAQELTAENGTGKLQAAAMAQAQGGMRLFGGR